MLALLFLPTYVEFKSRECENCPPRWMVFPVFVLWTLTSSLEQSCAEEVWLAGLSQDGAGVAPVIRVWEAGARVPPLQWEASPRNLGWLPGWLPSLVSPHRVPLNAENLERDKDPWALKRPVCKMEYLWSQCCPSKKDKIYRKPPGRLLFPKGWNFMLCICYCNVLSLTFTSNDTVISSCVLCRCLGVSRNHQASDNQKIYSGVF